MLNMEEMVIAGLPLHFQRPTSGSQLPTLAEWNQRYVEYVLNFTKGKKTAAARILGINRRTLYRRKKAKGSQNEHGDIMGELVNDPMHSSIEVPMSHQVQ